MTKSETLLPHPRDHNHPPQLLDDYYTADQLAEALDKCPRTIARWRTLGVGPPCTLISHTPYFKISSVHLWLASREQRSTRDVAKRRRRIGG
jgi:hypothetical protein